MADPTDKIPDKVTESLRRSGFPFQTAVTHIVEKSRNWFVHSTEYPWRRHDDDQFLDLIATNKRFFLTVECKKTREETLTFLLPLGRMSTGDIPDFRCLMANHDLKASKGTVYCQTWALWPPSPCSEFCVVSTSKSGRDQRLLERDAGLLIGATDAFAKDVGQHLKLGHNLLNPSLFLPVIVTNADLYATVYKPTNVSLKSGEFEEMPGEFLKGIPWIRFSKAFNVDTVRDLGTRTLFVVNAASFGEFLETLELSPDQPEGHPVKIGYFQG